MNKIFFFGLCLRQYLDNPPDPFDLQISARGHV